MKIQKIPIKKISTCLSILTCSLHSGNISLRAAAHNILSIIGGQIVSSESQRRHVKFSPGTLVSHEQCLPRYRKLGLSSSTDIRSALTPSPIPAQRYFQSEEHTAMGSVRYLRLPQGAPTTSSRIGRCRTIACAIERRRDVTCQIGKHPLIDTVRNAPRPCHGSDRSLTVL